MTAKEKLTIVSLIDKIGCACELLLDAVEKERGVDIDFEINALKYLINKIEAVQSKQQQKGKK